MRSLPTILKTELLAKSDWFQIESLHLEFSNGQQRVYERLRGSGYQSVLVVALPDPQHVLLVREYAVGVEQRVLGLPKGGVETGETTLEAANRELTEEVGMRAGRLRELGRLSLAPGHLCHSCQVVLAEELAPCTARGDEPEPLEIVRVPLARIPGLVISGELHEARAIAALFMALSRKSLI
ncbi:ADP compounds hydrolase NudE [Metapseudomonas furukawaii]|jgi:ADP-ribose diphosphatase|uniref:ADP compounds hydrolase NudE n=1 Tax=Metapseudomonas furukawaii TaxID=1149133 RepID=A0AAD1BYZ3_METFU|nr:MULTISPECIES: ADP compounds hydrolase NudE [Pseudomonas]ELS24948.1 ADP compounds hydrolase NudE [Pseudomonas furukawaii]OWJ97854.1 ADP compounds hydrolase NudE [Pseudomonas sp. A46]BAU72843.1 ADP compounds hydrolase NudE [Pseudomonas furukawaii]